MDIENSGKETSKINPVKILQDHFVTFRDFDTNKTSVKDIVIFIMVPLISAFGFCYFFADISSNLANNLFTIFSIFVGLLLNLLLLIYDLAKKFDLTEKNGELKRRFLREIFANISYSIFLSILIIFFLLISLVKLSYLSVVASSIVYFMVTNFFLTILMILKRIHILLFKEFSPRNQVKL